MLYLSLPAPPQCVTYVYCNCFFTMSQTFLHCTSCVTIFVCVTLPTFVYLIFSLNLYYWIRLPKLTDHSILGVFFGFLAESIVCLFNFASTVMYFSSLSHSPAFSMSPC